MNNPRIQREEQTIRAMIGMYCKSKHSGEHPCPECEELLRYALLRLELCPFQERKTTCAKCPVHCYKPDKRGKIREVMKFAGPRMLLHHPILAIRHLVDGQRKIPKKPSKHG